MVQTGGQHLSSAVRAPLQFYTIAFRQNHSSAAKSTVRESAVRLQLERHASGGGCHRVASHSPAAASFVSCSLKQSENDSPGARPALCACTVIGSQQRVHKEVVVSDHSIADRNSEFLGLIFSVGMEPFNDMSITGGCAGVGAVAALLATREISKVAQDAIGDLKAD